MDFATLAEELGLEKKDLHRLVLTFLDTTEQDLVLLGQAFSEQDVEKLHASAHHIKGAAGNLELNQIAEAARTIEDKARSGILEDPAGQIKLIRSRLELIRTQLSPQK